MLLFDTGKKLEKAFPKEQFDVLVELLEKRDGSLATSQEVQAVKAELKADVQEVRSELQAVKAELKADAREAELRLEAKIEASKHELLKWFIGMMIAQTGVMAALYALTK